MSIAHLLEDFGPIGKSGTSDTHMLVTEEQRLASYEEGYKAGWDDAVTAGQNDQHRVATDLENNLRDLNFTAEEAMEMILRDIRPLFDQLLQTILPPMAKQSLIPHLRDILMDAIESHDPAPIEITTAPRNYPAIEALTQSLNISDLVIHAEDTFGDGQVAIKLGQTERSLDLDALLTQVNSAVSAMFDGSLTPTIKESA